MKRLAVLGHPVGHSRSPAIQNAALAATGLAGQWHYGALDIAPPEFPERLRELPGRGFAGANVTVPHKVAALALSDVVSPRAAAIGAANTLSFTARGTVADNTDAPGLIEAIGGSARDARTLVLGAGGAARAVVWALNEAGAEVSVWNRTPARAEALCAELGGRPLPGAELDLASFDLVVNSTSAGLDGRDPFAELPFGPEPFRPGQTVVDMVYGERPSALLAAAAAAGGETVDGIEILVCQGALSFEIWTGVEAPRAAMRAAARSA